MNYLEFYLHQPPLFIVNNVFHKYHFRFFHRHCFPGGHLRCSFNLIKTAQSGKTSYFISCILIQNISKRVIILPDKHLLVLVQSEPSSI